MKKVIIAALAVVAMASCTSPSGERANRMMFVANEDIQAVSFTHTFRFITIEATLDGRTFNAHTEAYSDAYSTTESDIDSLGNKHDLQIGYFIRFGDMKWQTSAPDMPDVQQNIAAK